MSYNNQKLTNHPEDQDAWTDAMEDVRDRQLNYKYGPKELFTPDDAQTSMRNCDPAANLCPDCR